MTLNIIINLAIYNNEDESFAHDFTNRQYTVQIEEMCIKAIKISLHLAIVPIKKFLIILYVYMRLLFGKETRPPVVDPKAPPYKESYNVRKNKHLTYLKEYINLFLNTENQIPRFNLQTNHPVEDFIKRYMTLDHPIPRIFIAGLNRILITTLPNN